MEARPIRKFIWRSEIVSLRERNYDSHNLWHEPSHFQRCYLSRVTRAFFEFLYFFYDPSGTITELRRPKRGTHKPTQLATHSSLSLGYPHNTNFLRPLKNGGFCSRLKFVMILPPFRRLDETSSALKELPFTKSTRVSLKSHTLLPSKQLQMSLAPSLQSIFFDRNGQKRETCRQMLQPFPASKKHVIDSSRQDVKRGDIR